MIRLAALLISAATAFAGLEESQRTLIVGPSAARTAVNDALHRLLRCEDSAALSVQQAEQCSMIEFDTVDLHAIFKKRIIRLHNVFESSSAETVLTLASVESTTELLRVTADAKVDKTNVICVLPSEWKQELHKSFSNEQLPFGHVWDLSDEASQRLDTSLASLIEETSRAQFQAPSAAGRLLQVEPPIASAKPSEPQKPWAAWLRLSNRSQMTALIVFAVAAIILHKLVWWALDDAEAKLKAATDAVAALEAAALKAATDVSSPATAKGGEEVAASGGAGAIAEGQPSTGVLLSGGAAMPVSGATMSGGPSTAQLTSARAAVKRAYVITGAITLAALLFLTLVNVTFDRWKLFPLLSKNREIGTDMFWAFISAALLIGCYLGVCVSERDSDVLMGVKQTEEAKGWMMMCFLV